MKTYWIPLIFLVALSSCLRAVEPVYYIHQDAKDYAIFQPESYWVYQHNAQKDTNTVLSADMRMNTATIQRYQYEVHTSLIKSSFYQENLTYIASVQVTEEAKTSIRLKYDTHSWNTYKDMFVCNTPAGTGISQQIIYVAHHQQYEVAGKTYTDVREFESIVPLGYTVDDWEQIDKRVPQRVWYARHVGIIKKQLFNGETWHLIHHQAKQ